MASASAVVAVIAAAAFASAAIAVMAMTSAASACVHVFAVKTFREFLLCSFANGNHLSCEVERLSCHLMVQVHLYGILAYFKHYSRYHTAHAVHHRDCVAWNEKVFPYFAVDFERCLRQVYDPGRIHLTVTVSR